MVGLVPTFAADTGGHVPQRCNGAVSGGRPAEARLATSHRGGGLPQTKRPGGRRAGSSEAAGSRAMARRTSRPGPWRDAKRRRLGRNTLAMSGSDPAPADSASRRKPGSRPLPATARRSRRVGTASAKCVKGQLAAWAADSQSLAPQGERIAHHNLAAPRPPRPPGGPGRGRSSLSRSISGFRRRGLARKAHRAASAHERVPLRSIARTNERQDCGARFRRREGRKPRLGRGLRAAGRLMRRRRHAATGLTAATFPPVRVGACAVVKGLLRRPGRSAPVRTARISANRRGRRSWRPGTSRLALTATSPDRRMRAGGPGAAPVTGRPIGIEAPRGVAGSPRASPHRDREGAISWDSIVENPTKRLHLQPVMAKQCALRRRVSSSRVPCLRCYSDARGRLPRQCSPV